MFILDLERHGECSLTITGVDKFSSDAAPIGLKQAGTIPGSTPGLEAARHVDPFNGRSSVHLIQQHDEAFLITWREKFGLIYLDTSHDYVTECRQLRQALPLLADDGVLAGDDSPDRGVQKALTEVASGHSFFANRSWFATAGDFGTPARAGDDKAGRSSTD